MMELSNLELIWIESCALLLFFGMAFIAYEINNIGRRLK
jgi:hypothetical protein